MSNTLTLVNAATVTVDSTQPVTISAVIDGTVGLNKAGTGSLSLSAANIYSGTTTVSAGNLILGSTGTIANSTTIAVGSGATFTNNSGAPLTKNFNLTEGATLVGTFSSPGIAITGSLDSTAANYGFDKITLGTFTSSIGGLTLNLTGINAVGSFDLFTATPGLSFTSLVGSGLVATNFNGFEGTIVGQNLSYVFNGNTLSISAVPEPSTYGFLAGMGILGFVVYRRRSAIG